MLLLLYNLDSWANLTSEPFDIKKLFALSYGLFLNVAVLVKYFLIGETLLGL